MSRLSSVFSKIQAIIWVVGPSLGKQTSVDFYTRSHCRCHYAGTDMLALCCSRFRLNYCIHQCVEVLRELLNSKGDLANGAVDYVSSVKTVLDLTSFQLCYSLCYVISNSSGLRLGIRPLGPSIRPILPTTPIMLGVATTTS